jgi:oligopeptide transport system substrate-binding protein
MYRIIYLIFIFPFVFVSCSEKEQTTDSRTVFRYNEMGSITSLDPAASSSFENIWAVNQLFNGLVQVDDSMNVRPSIAKSWEISDKGLTYTFHLRNDVFFHPHPVFTGKPRRVTAKDFVYSFQRLFDPNVSRAISIVEIFNTTATNSGIDALNDSTLQIRIKRPFRPFLNLLTMKFFSVVPEEIVTYLGKDFSKYPIGTGPFRFKMWDDSKIVFLKNPEYFETENGQRLPFLDAVNISFIRDKQSAFLQLLRGEIDLISGADAINIDVVFNRDGKLNEEFNDKIQVLTGPYLKTDYLGFYIEKSSRNDSLNPTTNRLIRQAINYGIDREKMIRFFRNNMGKPASNGFIPPGLKGYDPSLVKGYSFNPEKARRILADAGFSGGVNLPPITLHITDNFSDVAEYIQSQLQKIGIQVKLQVEPSREINKAVLKGECDFFKKSWICDYPDPENFMFLFYSPNFSPDGQNYFHFKNKQFDALFLQSQYEQDDKVRMQLFREMEKLVIEEAPVIPLYHDKVIRLVNKQCQGMNVNPMNLLDLRMVRKLNSDANH